MTDELVTFLDRATERDRVWMALVLLIPPLGTAVLFWRRKR